MAENSGNFISKFAPQSCFFTTPGILTQSAAQAFGPVDENHYRLTANFDLPVGSPAYAVCSGIVLIQPQSGDATKVNLILRPFKQPIQGFNIKYFVYRGLSLASFFNGGTVLPNADGASDLVKKTNQSFKDFYTKFYKDQPVPSFLAKYIGYDPVNQAGDLLIDDLFFKQAVVKDGVENPADAFELPLLQMGDSLGLFAGNDCGMDVVISYGDYKLPQPNDEFVFDLKYARAAAWTIDVSGESNDFRKKQIKEQIFQFLDVAAYYGFHANDPGVVTIRTDVTKATKKGTAIYTDLLQGFKTKNNWYLYIQSDRTRSYNFYDNYLIEGSNTNSLKIGSAENNMLPRSYEKNGWPVLINDLPQNHSGVRNTLAMQLVCDNNPNAMLYAYVAQFDNAESNNFCGPLGLRQPADSNGQLVNFTRTITLSSPAVTSSGTSIHIASFTLLLYSGKVYNYLAGKEEFDEGITVGIMQQPNFFDDVFGDLKAHLSSSTINDNELQIVTLQRLQLINHYYHHIQYGVSAAQTTVVYDNIETGSITDPMLKRVTFHTENIAALNQATSITGTIAKSTKSQPTMTMSVDNNRTFQLPFPYYYTLTRFTDDGIQLIGLELKTLDDSIPDKILLGITVDELNILYNQEAMEGYSNVRLFLMDLFGEDKDEVSQEGIQFQKYRAGIVGENNNGILELLMPGNDILVYSIDRKYHFTKLYSQFMPELSFGQKYITENLYI